VPVDRYLLRCELKTARLFEASCQLGALAAQAPAGHVAALGAFGRGIGIAFQLLDDVLDVAGSAQLTGKHRGTDLLDGTVTLPLILARERDPQLAALDLRAITTADAAEALCARIAATGALEAARVRALEIVEAAMAQLAPLALEAGQREALSLVAGSVADRNA
jgi:geranylgeranyl pyrophosphate synthase